LFILKISFWFEEWKNCFGRTHDLQDPDTGSAYTVKEYQSFKTVNEDGWYHQSIVLKPLSNDSSYKDLVLSESDTNHHRVIGIFERVI
jgi:hypothetical protein